MTANLPIQLSRTLQPDELHFLTSQAVADGKSLDQVVLDAVRAWIAANKPELSTHAGLVNAAG